VSLLSVIACGLLLGPSAVFLAVPLALSVVTAIEVLYVEPRITLDRKVELDHRA
jgi:predicted PurR-regulated permease PerM